MKTVAFIPIKLNSERVPLKNIRKLHNGRPLISYILQTILKVEEVDEAYVYCSSEEICEYLPEGIKFLKRNPYYDLSTTSFNEVMESFCKLIDAEVYVLTHATAPFISKETISKAVNAVESGEHDSAMTVLELQEFLWMDGKPFNYSVDAIPRTQDLKPMYCETCGLFVFTKELILEKHRRIGNRPCLIPVSKIEACDINTEDDFIVADAMAYLFD